MTSPTPAAAGQDGELVTSAMVEKARDAQSAAWERYGDELRAALAAVAPDIRAAALRECAAELKAAQQHTGWLSPAAVKFLSARWEQG